METTNPTEQDQEKMEIIIVVEGPLVKRAHVSGVPVVQGGRGHQTTGPRRPLTPVNHTSWCKLARAHITIKQVCLLGGVSWVLTLALGPLK